MTRRVKKFFFMKEREKSDFVKPRVSEGIAFEDQQFSNANALASL